MTLMYVLIVHTSLDEEVALSFVGANTGRREAQRERDVHFRIQGRNDGECAGHLRVCLYVHLRTNIVASRDSPLDSLFVVVVKLSLAFVFGIRFWFFSFRRKRLEWYSFHRYPYS